MPQNLDARHTGGGGGHHARDGCLQGHPPTQIQQHKPRKTNTPRPVVTIRREGGNSIQALPSHRRHAAPSASASTCCAFQMPRQAMRHKLVLEVDSERLSVTTSTLRQVRLLCTIRRTEGAGERLSVQHNCHSAE